MPFNNEMIDGEMVEGFHETKNAFFGTVEERAGTCTDCLGNGSEILSLKRNVFHWGLNIHDQKDNVAFF